MRQPTKFGAPCEFCGKRIGRAMLKHYPFTRYCKGICMSSAAIADMQRRVAAGLPLFDDMKCANCGSELRVYAPRFDAKYHEMARICMGNCTFRPAVPA